MKTIQWLATTAALSLSLPVLASPTPTTTDYAFDAIKMSSSNGGYNPYTTNLTPANINADFGNKLTFKSLNGLTSTVNVSAFASTGTSGAIENAIVTQYNVTGGPSLGITSHNTSSNTEYSCSGSSCSTNQPQHAVDNQGAYETLLLSFSLSTKLNSLTIGFPTDTTNPDSDATVLYYKGTGVPPSIVGKTFTDLISSSGGWGLYGNAFDLATKSGYTGSLGNSASAQYFLVGAYIPIVQGKTAPTGADANFDYIKLRSISTTQVPEPGSLALFGIAGAAMVLGRRRRAARAA